MSWIDERRPLGARLWLRPSQAPSPFDDSEDNLLPYPRWLTVCFRTTMAAIMFCGSVYILWWNIEVHKINVGGDTGPLGVLSVFCGTVVNAYIAVTAFLRKYNLSHIKFALLADFAVASCILGAYLHTFINKEPSWIKWSYIGWKWQRRWKAAEVMLLVPCSLLYAAVVMAFVGFRITRGKREDRRKALHRNNNGNNNDIPMTTIQSNEPEAEVDPEIIDDPPPPYAADPPPYSEAPRQT